MPQEPRLFTDFVPALQLSIEEEFMGEAYFARLAELHQGRAAEAFGLMAGIETAMIAAMPGAVARHGLILADPKNLREEGRMEAEAMASLSWKAFLDHIHEDYPAFNDELAQLYLLAPPAEKADAQLLVDHELAFTDFADAERQGDPKAMDHLTGFLQRIA